MEVKQPTDFGLNSGGVFPSTSTMDEGVALTGLLIKLRILRHQRDWPHCSTVAGGL